MGWIIEIANEQSDRKPRKVLIKNAGISTSGSSEQYILFNNQRYSHIIDPRTGVGMTSLAMVTIVAQDGVTSDSLSTTACLLGRQATRGLLRMYPGSRAYFSESN